MKIRARREDLGLTQTEYTTLQSLNTPERIQRYLERMPINHEVGGGTLLTVREVLRQRRAHCIEGAMVAACAFWINGERPLVMHLKAVNDWHHVIALFRRNGYWGAISKTNAVFLRWRDPIYRTARELALSYVHEYANRLGEKTLRSYSRAFDLRRISPERWVTAAGSVWEMDELLYDAPHYSLVTPAQARRLRRFKPFERSVSKIVEYPSP